MNGSGPKIALVTAQAAADRPFERFECSRDTQRCSVHGLGHAIGADVWQGWQLSPEFLAALPGYDVLVVNGNTPLLPRLVEIAGLRRGGQPKICLLQEGDARVWDTLGPNALDDWNRAATAADLCLLYNLDHAPTCEALSLTITRQVVLPYPGDAECHRVDDREKAVFVASSVCGRRGGLAGIAVARRALDSAGKRDWKVYVPQGHYGNGTLEEREAAARLETHFGATVIPWQSYHDYLEVLARCRAAVNLDPCHSYGRFAADCAALGVPCIGFRHQPAQRAYWPAFSFEQPPGDFPRLALMGILRGGDGGAAKAAIATDKVFSPERVRAVFHRALEAMR